MICKFFLTITLFSVIPLFADQKATTAGDQKDAFYGLMNVALHEEGNYIWAQVQESENPQAAAQALFDEFLGRVVEVNPIQLELDFLGLTARTIHALFDLVTFITKDLEQIVEGRQDSKLESLIVSLTDKYHDFTEIERISFHELIHECKQLVYEVKNAEKSPFGDVFKELVGLWELYLGYEATLAMSYIAYRALLVGIKIDNPTENSGLWRIIKSFASLIAKM